MECQVGGASDGTTPWLDVGPAARLARPPHERWTSHRVAIVRANDRLRGWWRRCGDDRWWGARYSEWHTRVPRPSLAPRAVRLTDRCATRVLVDWCDAADGPLGRPDRGNRRRRACRACPLTGPPAVGGCRSASDALQYLSIGACFASSHRPTARRTCAALGVAACWWIPTRRHPAARRIGTAVPVRLPHSHDRRGHDVRANV